MCHGVACVGLILVGMCVYILGLCVIVLVCVMVCTWVVCLGVGLCHGVYLLACVSWYVLVGLCVRTCWVVLVWYLLACVS